MYLLDTNAISETIRKRPNPAFVAWLEALPSDQLHTSSVVVGELCVAAFSLPVPNKWHRLIEATLKWVTVLPLDVDVARRFGTVAADLRRRGAPLDTIDLQIAATALVHGLTVVTANRRHFDRIPGLVVHAFESGVQPAAGA